MPSDPFDEAKAKRHPVVGYKNPPIQHRFRKGQSGNPKGRPKGSANFRTLIAKQLNQRITIREGDKTRNGTKLEAMVAGLLAHGSMGRPANVNALVNVLRLFEFSTKDFALAEPLAHQEPTRIEVTFIGGRTPKAGQIVRTDEFGKAFSNKEGKWEATELTEREKSNEE